MYILVGYLTEYITSPLLIVFVLLQYIATRGGEWTMNHRIVDFNLKFAFVLHNWLAAALPGSEHSRSSSSSHRPSDPGEVTLHYIINMSGLTDENTSQTERKCHKLEYFFFFFVLNLWPLILFFSFIHTKKIKMSRRSFREVWGADNINGAIIFYICATVRTQLLVTFIEWL